MAIVGESHVGQDGTSATADRSACTWEKNICPWPLTRVNLMPRNIHVPSQMFPYQKVASEKIPPVDSAFAKQQVEQHMTWVNIKHTLLMSEVSIPSTAQYIITQQRPSCVGTPVCCHPWRRAFVYGVNIVADNVATNKACNEKSLKHKETLPSLLTMMRSEARSDFDASLHVMITTTTYPAVAGSNDGKA
ncbi:hypothetical protein BX666DRAFT_1878016 [Dichotomocladium elegans]|nr:hypothetical protein BX666DRAFT_1878016 [Dichotomocladium elegans]